MSNLSKPCVAKPKRGDICMYMYVLEKGDFDVRREVARGNLNESLSHLITSIHIWVYLADTGSPAHVSHMFFLLLEPFPWQQQIQVQLSGNNPVLHDGSVPWRLNHLDPMFAGWHPTADHGGIQHVLIHLLPNSSILQLHSSSFIHVLELFKICNPGWSATQILMILIDFYQYNCT